MRVLVVEDARDMNRLIEKTLKKAGYSVDCCFDGEDSSSRAPAAPGRSGSPPSARGWGWRC